MPITSKYNIEMTRFSPQPVLQQMRVKSPEECIEILRYAEVEQQFCLALDILGDKCTLATLILYLNGDRAFVRLQEHCEWIMIDPMQTEKGNVVDFINEEGDYFQENFEDTVSRSQAVQFLRYWLSPHDNERSNLV